MSRRESLADRLARVVPPAIDAIIARGGTATATTIAIETGTLSHQVAAYMDREWMDFAPNKPRGGWRNATAAERKDLSRVRA